MERYILTKTAVHEPIFGFTAIYGRWDTDFSFWLGALARADHEKIEVTPTWRFLNADGSYFAHDPPILGEHFRFVQRDHYGPQDEWIDRMLDRADPRPALEALRMSRRQRRRRFNPCSRLGRERARTFAEYITLIPSTLRRLAAPAKRWQWTVLRALRCVPEFAQFLDTELRCVGPQFVITCLSLGDAATLPADQLVTLVRTIATGKRDEILTKIAKVPVSPSVVRLIMKCQPALEKDEFTNLLSIMEDAIKAKVLRHAGECSPLIVGTLARLPHWACHSNLLFLLNNQMLTVSWSEPNPFEMLRALPSDPPKAMKDRARALLQPVTTARELRSAVTKIYQAYPFPLPPIPGDHRLTGLGSAQAMQHEARAMRNCLRSLVGEVLGGESYYFLWSDRQRATVQLARHRRTWGLGMIAGPKNEPVDEATVTAIRSLVEEQLSRLSDNEPAQQ